MKSWKHLLGLRTRADEVPARLNFAVTGSLYVPFGRIENFHIGQGHLSGSNNWWLGSQECVKEGPYELVCENAGVSFSPGANDHQIVVRQLQRRPGASFANFARAENASGVLLTAASNGTHIHAQIGGERHVLRDLDAGAPIKGDAEEQQPNSEVQRPIGAKPPSLRAPAVSI